MRSSVWWLWMLWPPPIPFHPRKRTSWSRSTSWNCLTPSHTARCGSKITKTSHSPGVLFSASLTKQDFDLCRFLWLTPIKVSGHCRWGLMNHWVVFFCFIGCVPTWHRFLLQGAAVLRMLSEFITETIFSQGLHVSTRQPIKPISITIKKAKLIFTW